MLSINSCRVRRFTLIVAVILAAAIGGMASTSAGTDSWYLLLYKSQLNPPSYVFGLVWPILYILMMVSAFLAHKKVFSIFVEGVQNVIRYSAESLGPEDQDESEVRYGLVTIGQDPKGISVQCGNLIYNKDVQKMKERVNQVEGKDKDQLKKLYKQKMMEGPEEGSKGASLGLVEMARRSGYPIEFAFEEINQEHTFFCIKAIV